MQEHMMMSFLLQSYNKNDVIMHSCHTQYLPDLAFARVSFIYDMLYDMGGSTGIFLESELSEDTDSFKSGKHYDKSSK